MNIVGDLIFTDTSGELVNALLYRKDSVPSVATEGKIYWNTVEKKAFIYSGTSWVQVSLQQDQDFIAGVGIGCIALGVLFAFIFSPYKQVGTPDTSSSASDSNQLASYSGIIRRVEDVDGGVSYYLEKSDETRLLLRSSKIDLSFFEGSSVTAEGVAVEGSDGGDEILFVSKIRLK